MSNIEWEDGAVCLINGMQRGYGSVWVKKILNNNFCISDVSDFQLNEPRQGDYIPKSELGTEQKYNDAVEVFGLFCYKCETCYESMIIRGGLLLDLDGSFCSSSNCDPDIKRKITYNQLMAIGKLKRLMNERDKVKDSERPNSSEVVMQKNKPVVAQVMIDLTERMEIGIKTYGEALRANNGRDALQDAYEEALDLACYLKQAMIERDNANNTN